MKSMTLNSLNRPSGNQTRLQSFNFAGATAPVVARQIKVPDIETSAGPSVHFTIGTFGIKMLVALMFALTCATTGLNANIITVTNTADTGPDVPAPGSLRSALAGAANGDTIDATVISGTITLMSGMVSSAELTVDKDVTILGPGPASLIVNANHLSRVFHVTPGHTVAIAGLTMVNGNPSGPFAEGGGILNDHSVLTVSNCTLSGNSVRSGGAIYNDGNDTNSAMLTVNRCTITGNSAQYGGGIFSSGDHSGSAILKINGGFVTGNSADFTGGGVLNTGSGGSATAEINGSSVSGNSAAESGGGIFNFKAILKISASILNVNSAGENGGGIYNDGSGSDNHASLEMTNSTLNSNTAESSGGGIYNDGQTSGDATVKIMTSKININNAVAVGGGVFSDGDSGNVTVEITDSTVSGNTAGAGGISFFGSVGGIYNTGMAGNATLTATHCLIAGNRDNGVLIANFSPSSGKATLTVIASTIDLPESGNCVGIASGASGSGSAIVTLLASTVHGTNSGNAGLGVASIINSADATADATLKIGNTIVNRVGGGPGNANFENNGGTVISLGFNLSNEDAGGGDTGTGPGGFLNATGDRRNTDPILGLLADNGGPTFTHLPMPGSPAIDQGTSDLLTAYGITTDQRHLPLTVDLAGIPNPILGNGTDIGAVEVQFIGESHRDLVWTNQAGGDWNVATNWNPNFVPNQSDNAQIAVNVTVTLASDGECLDLTLGTLFNAPIVMGNGTLTVHGASTWVNGTMSGSGRTVIESGASLDIANPSVLSLTGRTLENGGTIYWTGTGNIGMNSGAVITNRTVALFDVQNVAAFNFASGINRFDNAGIFRKSANAGTTTFASGVNFNNYGSVEIQAGTLLCNGGFTNNGAVNLSAGATNRLAGGGSANGLFSAPATALVEWTSGTFTLNAGAQLNGTGLYRINGGTLTANTSLAADNLDLIGGSLDGSGAVTVNNVMNWPSGTMGGSGRTIVATGAALTVANPSSIVLSARTLENGGTALWTGAGNIALLSGVITNRAGALFHVQNAAILASAGGGPRFDNAGTFRKSANTGTTTIFSGVNFNNYGTVDIRTGILAANGGYVSSSNALLNCALGGTTAGTSYGQLQVAGTVMLNGGLSVDLLPGFTPAANDIFTVVTAGSRSGTFASFAYPSNQVTMQLSNTASSVVLRVTNVFMAISQPILLQPELFGSNIKLTWTATSNVTYRLESNPAVGSTNWSAIPGDVTTLSNTASKLDALTSSNRFYRVHVLP
jgi:hypothetical protein